MTYLARAENLRRNLDKNRSGKPDIVERNFALETAIFLGGLAWFASLAAELLWHILGITIEQHSNQLSFSFPTCVVQSIRTWTTNAACFESMTQLVPKILLISTLSSWWHPKLHQASHTKGSLSKQKDYYALQIIFVLVRGVGYWLSTRHATDSPASRQPIHGFMAVFITIVSVRHLLSTQTLTLPSVHHIFSLHSPIPQTPSPIRLQNHPYRSSRADHTNTRPTYHPHSQHSQSCLPHRSTESTLAQNLPQPFSLLHRNNHGTFTLRPHWPPRR